MSKYDAKRALEIYKHFSKQTNQVVDYLSTARTYENATRLEIPKLKHAPTSLTSSLEEYLNDPDFEINRRQYLAQQEAKKRGKNMNNVNGESSSGFTKPAASKKHEGTQNFEPPPGPPPPPSKSEPKGPAPDLIDFFDSIEQNQQPMAIQSQAQSSNFQSGPQLFQPQLSQQAGYSQPQTFLQNGQLQQQNNDPFGNLNGNPFGPSQSQQTGQQNFAATGYNSFTQQQQQQQQQPQPQPPPFGQQPNSSASLSQQQNALDFSPPLRQQPQQQFPFATGQQAQSTNPFRQSVMPQKTSAASTLMNAPALPTSQPYQSTNPFARNLAELTSQPSGQSTQSTPFGSPPPQPQSAPFTSPPLQPQSTPFTSQHLQPQTSSYAPQAQPLQPQHTGTNPFARMTQQTSPNPAPLIPTPTGSTNPFRQSSFPKQQTGQGWQAGQGSLGGLENLETVPVFPRPGQGQGSGIGGGQLQGGGWP